LSKRNKKKMFRELLIFGVAISLFFHVNAMEARFSWMGGECNAQATGGEPTSLKYSAIWSFVSSSNTTVYAFGSADGGEAGKLWKMAFISKAPHWTQLRTIALPLLYGTQYQGTNVTNPGLRSRSITFMDSTGGLWLYGGVISGVFMSDWWKYEEVNDVWIWYGGTLGSNILRSIPTDPGHRSGSSFSFSHRTNRLYFYSGHTNVTGLNAADLWSYDPSTRSFTWETDIFPGGDQEGTSGSCMGIDETQGVIYVYGGQSITTRKSDTNSFFSYDYDDRKTVIIMPKSYSGAPVQGALGVFNSTYNPGSRFGHSCWFDGTIFYIFGGESVNGYLNDVWAYDTTKSQWAWVGGGGSMILLNKYLFQFDMAASRSQQITFRDQNNDFWFGYGAGATSLGDMWRIQNPLKCGLNFTGSLCSIPICYGQPATSQKVCSFRGFCQAPNLCQCNSTFSGSNCQYGTCYGIPGGNPSVCSGNGACTDLNNCTCNTKYGKFDCSVPICFGIWSTSSSVCSAKGQCISPDTCKCIPGAGSQDCSQPTCFGIPANDPTVCQEHGTCAGVDSCVCQKGYTSRDCKNPICGSFGSDDPNVCNGRGTCTNSFSCSCHQNFTGLECEYNLCFGLGGPLNNTCNGKGECVAYDTCRCFHSLGDRCQHQEFSKIGIQSMFYMLISFTTIGSFLFLYFIIIDFVQCLKSLKIRKVKNWKNDTTGLGTGSHMELTSLSSTSHLIDDEE
jgi:hypothetical protein